MNLDIIPRPSRLSKIRSIARTSTPAPSIATGLTIMEAVAHVAGLPITEAPPCTDPLLAAFVTVWAGDLDDIERDALLLPLVPELVGAMSPRQSHFGHLALAWLLRDAVPGWLRIAGHDGAAKFEADLPTPQSGAAITLWLDELGSLSRPLSYMLQKDYGRSIEGSEIGRHVVPRRNSSGENAAASIVSDLHGEGSPLARVADAAVTVCQLSAALACARRVTKAVREVRGGDVELAATAAVMRSFEPERIERQQSALRLIRRMTAPRILA